MKFRHLPSSSLSLHLCRAVLYTRQMKRDIGQNSFLFFLQKHEQAFREGCEGEDETFVTMQRVNGELNGLIHR